MVIVDIDFEINILSANLSSFLLQAAQFPNIIILYGPIFDFYSDISVTS